MSPASDHSDIGPELRQLAQAILERLDPALRAAAAAMASETLTSPGLCQQVWCPVCAVAALVRGEQHPLLALLSEHSVTLLTVVQAMTAESAGGAKAPEGTVPPPPPPSSNGSAPNVDGGARAGGYEHIPIVVEPPVDSP